MGFTEDWYPAEQLAAVTRLAQRAYLSQNLRQAVPGHFIEIGVWEGRSAIAIAQTIPLTITLCAVDTWAGNQAEAQAIGAEHPSVTAAQQRDVYAAFTTNVREAGLTNIRAYQMDWQEFVRTLYPYGGTPDSQGIAFLHLDASHDYESVYQQIHTFYPYMLPGSIMCGDDFANASIGRVDLNGGVERAVRNFFGYKTRSNGNLWWANL